MCSKNPNAANSRKPMITIPLRLFFCTHWCHQDWRCYLEHEAEKTGSLEGLPVFDFVRSSSKRNRPAKHSLWGSREQAYFHLRMFRWRGQGRRRTIERMVFDPLTMVKTDVRGR